MKLYVATQNRHKISEMAAILPEFEIIADEPGDVVENAPDFAGNALIKVRAIAARRAGEWCMADDSGLEVAALGGAPGVMSARYAGVHGDTRANNALLLENMKGVADRRARFVCTCALVSPQGVESVVEGECRGEILHSQSGTEGFGYDPLFRPEGRDVSFAELSPEDKNAISHRGAALTKVKELVTGHG